MRVGTNPTRNSATLGQSNYIGRLRRFNSNAKTSKFTLPIQIPHNDQTKCMIDRTQRQAIQMTHAPYQSDTALTPPYCTVTHFKNDCLVGLIVRATSVHFDKPHNFGNAKPFDMRVNATSLPPKAMTPTPTPETRTGL